MGAINGKETCVYGRERHKQAIRLKAAEPLLDEWLLNYKDVASNYPPDRQPSPIAL